MCVRDKHARRLRIAPQTNPIEETSKLRLNHPKIIRRKSGRNSLLRMANYLRRYRRNQKCIQRYWVHLHFLWMKPAASILFRWKMQSRKTSISAFECTFHNNSYFWHCSVVCCWNKQINRLFGIQLWNPLRALKSYSTQELRVLTHYKCTAQLVTMMLLCAAANRCQWFIYVLVNQLDENLHHSPLNDESTLNVRMIYVACAFHPPLILCLHRSPFISIGYLMVFRCERPSRIKPLENNISPVHTKEIRVKMVRARQLCESARLSG